MGIHSSGFRDFLLKPELLRAIVDSGFEHPSEGRTQCPLFGSCKYFSNKDEIESFISIWSAGLF